MATPEVEPTNILVVDDLPEKILVYQTILDEMKQNVVTARSGEDALRAVLAHDFAVILLDVNMPGLNGLETAALIRRRKRSAHTPIIFLTAFADEVRAAEGYARGAVDYITTPVVPEILRAKVRVFVDLYRMTQQVKRQAEERIALAEERSRREAAEEANRRLAFLTSAGAVLGGSLDYELTATDAARLALGAPADEAVLVVPAFEGNEERVYRGRTTPGGPVVDKPVRAELAPLVSGVVDRVATANEPVASPETLLAVPLRARKRAFAVLVLSRAASGVPFGEADMALAETFASRAAIALENARLYHELQQADRQKNEFLSMLAHELRNPLAPIRNANEVLSLQGHEPERVRWAQGVIDRQLTHLVRLVDDLLDVSRLTRGKVRLLVETVDLRAVVAQAIEVVRPLVALARHEFEASISPRPLWVKGDPARLVQVFGNLLNNAVKYTDPGGRISLTVDCRPACPGGPGERLPALVEVRIRDTGVGIAPEVLPRVFDLFLQANRSLDRSQGGLGIGLTVVRRLVEMHEGSVEARSQGLGKGSEFVVRLPLVAAAPRAEGVAGGEGEEGGAQEATAGPLRVVVVDDNVDGVETLADLIGLLGHEVRVAHDGQAALEAAREFDPDLILLDIGLPGMDGYEVARRLRRDQGSRAAIVALSGYGREEDRTCAREAGFEQYFVKPVEFDSLCSLLERVQSTRRLPV